VNTLEIVLIAVVGGLALLALGGYVATARRARASKASFDSELDAVNRELAAAHAGDKGWSPDLLDQAALSAFAQARPEAKVEEHALVAVIDNPGVEEDHAVYRFVTETGEVRLTLGRTAAGDWVTESVA
jgi:hypothetical protein